MTNKTLSKEEFATLAGTRLSPSDWVVLSQDRINTFADCTEDHQFIHIDEKKAAQTPFKGTVAHGLLTLSMLPRLIEDNFFALENMTMALNYGFDKVRFLAPVRAGKRVRLNGEVLSVDRKEEGRFLIKTKLSVEIEDEETPALVAEWLNMFIAN